MMSTITLHTAANKRELQIDASQVFHYLDKIEQDCENGKWYTFGAVYMRNGTRYYVAESATKIQELIRAAGVATEPRFKRIEY